MEKNTWRLKTPELDSRTLLHCPEADFRSLCAFFEGLMMCHMFRVFHILRALQKMGKCGTDTENLRKGGNQLVWMQTPQGQGQGLAFRA